MRFSKRRNFCGWIKPYTKKYINDKRKLKLGINPSHLLIDFDDSLPRDWLFQFPLLLIEKRFRFSLHWCDEIGMYNTIVWWKYEMGQIKTFLLLYSIENYWCFPYRMAPFNPVVTASQIFIFQSPDRQIMAVYLYYVYFIFHYISLVVMTTNLWPVAASIWICAGFLMNLALIWISQSWRHRLGFW